MKAENVMRLEEVKVKFCGLHSVVGGKGKDQGG